MKSAFLLIAFSTQVTLCQALKSIDVVKDAESAILSGQITNSPSQSIKILLEIDNITRRNESYIANLNHGEFTSNLPLTKPTFVYTYDGTNYVSGLIEPGDQVTISYDAKEAKKSLKFSGRGSEKFSFLSKLLQFNFRDSLLSQLKFAKSQKYPFDYLLKYVDSTGLSFQTELSQLKGRMTADSYKEIEGIIKALIMGFKYRSVSFIYHESIDETIQKRQGDLSDYSKNYLQQVLVFEDSFYFSSYYINEVYNLLFKHFSAKTFSNEVNDDIPTKYSFLTTILPAKLKVPVLTLFLEGDIEKLNQAEEIEKVIQTIFINPNDSIYQKYITEKFLGTHSFKKGSEAPDFQLEDKNGEKVTLKSFGGKVVYIDFWFAACAPCHALFETLEPLKSELAKNKDIVFLCVSIDSKSVWKKALSKYAIQGYHTYTEDKQGDHPIINAYKVQSYPTSCLIDKNGKIFMANPAKNPGELKKQILEALNTAKSNK